MNPRKFARIFGIVLVLVGVLGFIPGITADGHLLGIFEVDTVHNIVHILTGIVALLLAGTEAKARMFFKVFGVIYALVLVLGLLMDGDVLGLFHVNMADNVLHLVIAVVALWIGFGKSSSENAGNMNMGGGMA
jgi:hypothetical protein